MKSDTKAALGSIIFAAGGVAFLFTTDPQKLAPILLLIPFILFFLSLFLAIVFITTVMAKDPHAVQKRKSLVFSVLLAGYPIMLLLLQSIGQLAFRDVVTLTLLLVLSVFYVARSSFGA